MKTPAHRRGPLLAVILTAILATLFAYGCGVDDPLPVTPSDECAAGTTECGGECVDTSKDLGNCGACGTTCAKGEACSNGDCVVVCPPGLSDCGGKCINTQTDPASCGGCDAPCDAGMVCSNGSCSLSCQAALTDCAGQCINTQTDIANCGGCGALCDAGEVCSTGACALSCQIGLTDCSGLCINTQTDLAHCGGCSAPCDAGEVCSEGKCAVSCQAGLTECGGLCVNTDADLAHCGSCDAPCAADAVCSSGECVSTTPVTIRILDVSDWHGQLDPINVAGVDIGGAAVLSTYFKNERAQNPNSLTLTAGDSIGASPPLSSFFDEVPAIKAMNVMGFAANTFGNHEFDRGPAHLQTILDLATFKYVSSNLQNVAANLTGVVQPFHIFKVGGVSVAIIAVTSPDAPQSLFPGNLGTITIADPIASAMAAKSAAQAAGAKVFIAMAHMGATGFNAGNGTYSGPLIDFATGLSGFHLVLGDHTNLEVSTVINGARVIENRSKGVTYARIDLTVVPWTGALVQSTATFLTPISSAVLPDPAVEAVLAPYRSSLSAVMDTVLGVGTGLFPRDGVIERTMEVAIGNLTADAIRMKYGTQIALVNGGGLRSPIPSSYMPLNTALRRTTAGYAAGPPYDLVRGDVFSLLPFGNVVVTRTVTGSQLWAMLENGVSVIPAAGGRFPQISGFRFSYSVGAASGSRVTTVALNDNTPIPADGTVYTLATIDFLNSGGDGYTMLADGMGTTRDVMANVVAEHITAAGTITPTIDGRITKLP